MEGFKNNYQLLIEKLDAFIRKYYLNQIVRGSLYFVGLTLALFLGLNFAEHLFYFPSGVRKVLFWSFVGISGVSAWAWLVVPTLHFFRLGKVISHEQAAKIVGDHFLDVRDKLLNILQLRKQVEHDASGRELIMASINQKSEDIKLVPFKSAINLYQNKKYLRFALPPLLLLLFVLLASPSLIKGGLTRLLNYNQEFEREAPFRFIFDKNNLKVVQFQDFDLVAKVEGSVLPNDVFLNMNGYEYRMTKIDASTFGFRFSNVQQDINFKILSGAIATPQYTLEVLKKPNIASFEVKLDYPDYTGRADEVLQSVGDLMLPQGTAITWFFNAQNTDDIKMSFGDGKAQTIARQGETNFYFSTKATADAIYKVFFANKMIATPDSVAYSMTVIPDLYPSISLQKFEDSTQKNSKRLFFAGDASDDYGLKSVNFNYQIKHKDGKQEPLQRELLLNPQMKQIQYQYIFNVEKLQLQAGDEVIYYFEAFDNDGVNGSKSAKTEMMIYKQPTVEQIEKQMAKNNDEIKDDLKKAMEESKKIQQDVQKLREKLLQQKEIDFNTKKEAEKLIKRQQELERQIEQAKQNFQENREQQEQLNPKDEEILKKQEQLEKMFDDLKNPEVKEMLKQLEELLQKQNKDQALDKMEEMQLSNEEMQKELARMEELFKQLEVETEMQQHLDKLEEMIQKQDELSKDTEGGQKQQDELQKKQEDLKKDFDKLQEDLKKTEKKNDKLERKEDIPDTKQEQRETEQEMKNSQDQLQQKQNSKAAKSQKNAANKMREMKNKIQQNMASAEMEQMEEDMKSLRQLLENLVGLSFDQENLMADMNRTADNTPRWVKLVQQQKKLRDDFSVIEDSLQALSKRQAAIQTFVTEKVTDVKEEMRKAMKSLEDRRRLEGGEAQQRTMTYVNDLALMLSEAMEQMQQQMQQQQEGNPNSSCKKPGQGKPKPGNGKQPKDKIGEGQQELNKQLQQMRDKMKKGQGMGSKEFAQMAAKQAALRNALRQKQKEMQERGKGDKGLQDLLNQMDKTETELVNKQLSDETLRRNQDIETRLLESERAERERGEDEQRKAQAAREQQQNQLPPSLQEYLKKRQSEIEMYRTVSPMLRPYYKQLVEDYQKTLRSGGK